MAPRVPKRLQLQLEHLQDMIREQDRMVLADVEPTTSDRDDMVELLQSVKESIEKESTLLIESLKPEYERLCTSLQELGYNVAPYELQPPQPRPTQSGNAAGKPSSIRSGTKPKRHVHFEKDFYEDDDVVVQGPPADPPREQYRDEPSVGNSQLFGDNQLLLEDQDRRLESIGGSVGRQRVMGEQIHGELTMHNDMLGDVEAQVDHADSRLTRLTSGVYNFNRKSRECGTCSIILLLVLILFIVIII